MSSCRLLSQSFGNILELTLVETLFFVSTVTTILILDLICRPNISQHNTKFRQFKKFHRYLTSRLTTSGARIGDLVVLFCTHFIRVLKHVLSKKLILDHSTWSSTVYS